MPGWRDCNVAGSRRLGSRWNLWAAPFASAIRRAGGQLVANDRIPIQAIIAALQAEAESETSEGE